MTLSEFLLHNVNEIVDDWEEFARTLTPAAENLSSEALRDFAREMIERVAENMALPQTREEQRARSRGTPSEQSSELHSAARVHAEDRLAESFTQDQLVAEFRALRAYVIRRWTSQISTVGADELDELIRFDEAIDELLAKSVSRYAEQLHEAREELDAALEREQRLRALDQEKDHFLSMLAHELRNPLAPIMNAAGILRLEEREHSERTRRATRMLDRQARHLVVLVDDLLDTARINSGQVQLRREILDMARLVQQRAEDFRPQFQAGGITLELSLSPEPVEVDADPDRLAQVVDNLLDNALKFTSQGGSVVLDVRQTGDEARLLVTDTGVGIARERLSKLFDLFEQGEVSLDRTAGGLGLGLYLVNQLIGLHGGSVRADSEGPEQGSTFEVRLPLAASHGGEKGKAQTAQEAQPGRPLSRRVLVVEDNPDAADSLLLLLEVLGHDSRKAADGGTAVRMAEQFSPEVVLLDLGLPDMDGFQVARELRARHGNSLRLVAVTGYSEEPYRRAAKEAGFDDHLVKPPSLDDIMKALDQE